MSYTVVFSEHLFKVNMKIFLLSDDFSVLDNSGLRQPDIVVIAE